MQLSIFNTQMRMIPYNNIKELKVGNDDILIAADSSLLPLLASVQVSVQH